MLKGRIDEDLREYSFFFLDYKMVCWEFLWKDVSMVDLG